MFPFRHFHREVQRHGLSARMIKEQGIDPIAEGNVPPGPTLERRASFAGKSGTAVQPSAKPSISKTAWPVTSCELPFNESSYRADCIEYVTGGSVALVGARGFAFAWAASQRLFNSPYGRVTVPEMIDDGLRGEIASGTEGCWPLVCPNKLAVARAKAMKTFQRDRVWEHMPTSSCSFMKR